MTAAADDRLQIARDEVRRSLGHCLLTLQSYERVMKAIMADHELSARLQSGSTAALQVCASADLSRSTLGQLVQQLTNSFLTSDEGAERPASAQHDVAFHMRVQVRLSVDDFERIKHGLTELVLLRNNLVHHFLDQHDLKSLEGCQKAIERLAADSCTIDQRLGELREWAQDLSQARRYAAEILASGDMRKFIVGGAIHWPSTTIIAALRQAASKLAIDGWTHVETASDWITSQDPGERPDAYGCRSWRQVLHQSGVFELQYRRAQGRRSAWYRARAGA